MNLITSSSTTWSIALRKHATYTGFRSVFSTTQPDSHSLPRGDDLFQTSTHYGHVVISCELTIVSRG